MKNTALSLIRVCICLRIDSIQKIGKITQLPKKRWRKNIMKYVIIWEIVDGITMRYRTGQSLDLSANIIGDIGPIGITDDSDSQQQVLSME